MFPVKYLLLLAVALHLAQSQPWTKSCADKPLACIRRKAGKVCGYDPIENKYKIYESICSYYTEACNNHRDIGLMNMRKCENKDIEGERREKGRANHKQKGSLKPPTNVFVRPAKTVVSEGDDVTLVCYAVGKSAVEFLWEVLPYIDPGADAGVIPTKITFQVTTATLTLKKVTREKSGTYTCTAYNGAGSLSASATINVLYPPTVKVTPSYKSIKKGQTAFFKCSADGNPKPDIKWKKGSYVKSKSSTLVVRYAQLKDHGNYQCVASNSEAVRSAEVLLNVEVDGGWSSETCTLCGRNPYNNGKCQKKCERKCNNPTPRNGGAECPGDREIARDCPKDRCKVPNRKKGCFPGDARVNLASGGSVLMRDLKIGDVVLAVTDDNKIVPSKILTFIHREENTDTLYKNIETDQQTVSLTPDHLVFVSEDENIENLQAIFASKVQKGMYVNEVKSGQIQFARVKSTSNSSKSGMYAPLTEHGTIVVDNVMSSCYAVVNSHWLAHVGLSPLRWYYMYAGLVQDHVPKEGIHWYPSLLQPMLPVLPHS